MIFAIFILMLNLYDKNGRENKIKIIVQFSFGLDRIKFLMTKHSFVLFRKSVTKNEIGHIFFNHFVNTDRIG